MKPTLGLYEKSMPDDLSWVQKLNAGKRAGFDFLEICIDESDMRLSRLNETKQERFEILTATRNTQMYIDTMCLSGHRKYPLGSMNPQIQRQSRIIMEKAIEYAYDIGVRIIQLAGYDVYYGEISTAASRECFLENLFKSSRIAARNGIILALETMENDFCNTIEKAMFFVKEVNSPYLKVYPDIGNVTNATDNVASDIRKGEGSIVATHLKETMPNVFRNMKFGTGHVDFKAATKILKTIGVMKFTAEFWYDGGTDWEAHLKIAHDYLKPYLLDDME